jgi:hypothetical protein
LSPGQNEARRRVWTAANCGLLAGGWLTEAERDERRRRDRERLAEATRTLLSSEGWRAWLRARARRHGYSLLI